MIQRHIMKAFSLALVLGIGSFYSSEVLAQSIILRSGQVNGQPGIIPTQNNIGDVDDIVTYWTRGTGGSLSTSPFTMTDFDKARGIGCTIDDFCGMAELIVPHPSPTWIPSLPSDADARWINHNHGSIASNTGSGRPATSVLYAVPFTITTNKITSASIDFEWAVDDLLGDSGFSDNNNPIGVYINSPQNALNSSFSGDQNPLMGTGQLGTASQGNIEDFLVSGLNHLYIYQRDQGGSVSGLIFSANITIESIESVPESISGWSLLGFGAFALTTTRFKTKN